MTARGKGKFYGLFVLVIVAIILSTSPGFFVSKVHAMPSLLPLPKATTSGYLPVRTATTDVGRFLAKNLIVGSSAVPIPNRPNGSITDKTPTFRWTRITGATSYQFQVRKGSTIVYTKKVLSSVCGAKNCLNTPTTKLVYAAYKWRVRAKVGGIWKAWSAYKAFTVIKPITGFNSQFNGNSTGWEQHPGGTWTNSSSTYYTNGRFGYNYEYSSSSYNQNYTNFTYEARIHGYDPTDTTTYSGLIVRGTPTFNSTNNGWKNGYYFEITNQGDYAIFVKQNDIWLPSPTGGWCQTNKLVKFGRNTLKVVANGSNLKFYINGSLVFDGSDSTFSSGRVGLFFYKISHNTQFIADWATLSLSTTSSLEAEPLIPIQGDGSVDPSALYPSP